MRQLVSFIVETSADSEHVFSLITDTIAPMVIDLIEDEDATIDEGSIIVQEEAGQ
tara:strand:- start:93 stop:257 length:165 start_codon:yes stop_codon:yes gene_type:complete